MTGALGTTARTFPDHVMRRALIIKQESRTHWHVVIRNYGARSRRRKALVPGADRLRPYARAIEEAASLSRKMGLPVLIEPKGEASRRLTHIERYALRNAYTPSRPTLDDILMTGPNYDR